MHPQNQTALSSRALNSLNPLYFYTMLSDHSLNPWCVHHELMNNQVVIKVNSPLCKHRQLTTKQVTKKPTTEIALQEQGALSKIDTHISTTVSLERVKLTKAPWCFSTLSAVTVQYFTVTGVGS